MDFIIDPDTVAIAETVLRFVEREVLPLQQRHHDQLGSERTSVSYTHLTLPTSDLV